MGISFKLSYPHVMSIESIVSQIDAEIAVLTRARSLLAGAGKLSGSMSGRIPGQNAPRRKRRVLSADARKRIADAQRRRWAAQRARSK